MAMTALLILADALTELPLLPLTRSKRVIFRNTAEILLGKVPSISQGSQDPRAWGPTHLSRIYVENNRFKGNQREHLVTRMLSRHPAILKLGSSLKVRNPRFLTARGLAVPGTSQFAPPEHVCFCERVSTVSCFDRELFGGGFISSCGL